MMCRKCRERGQNWEGDAPRCAFSKHETFFDADNWNCATMNALRLAAESVTIRNEAQQSAALMPWGDGFILLGWYKERGRTELARFVEEMVAGPLPLVDAEDFLRERSHP